MKQRLALSLTLDTNEQGKLYFDIFNNSNYDTVYVFLKNIAAVDWRQLGVVNRVKCPLFPPALLHLSSPQMEPK